MSRNGDRDAAFEEFVRVRSPALMRLAHLLARDAASAQDLLQIALIRSYARWRRISSNPEAYVRQVLVTVAIDESRRPHRREEPVGEIRDDVRGEATVDPYDGVDALDALDTALRELPVRQRAAVVLRHREGMSVAQTAQLLGCSEGTVRSQAARGLDKLRAAYGQAARQEADHE